MKTFNYGLVICVLASICFVAGCAFLVYGRIGDQHIDMTNIGVESETKAEVDTVYGSFVIGDPNTCG